MRRRITGTGWWSGEGIYIPVLKPDFICQRHRPWWRECWRSWDFRVRTGFAESAVLGILETGRPGNTIAVRADMDALGMQDEKDVPYRSVRDGVCHACGHDVHTALLLGLASYLSEHRDQIPGGCVKLIFQPAEEGPAPGGAKLIVDSGGVERRGCHIRSPLPASISGRCDGMQVRKLFCQR
ncbi:MAG: M20/M25/M40 family metallo-hydrolase [Enterocloster bolteae]